MRPVLSFAFIAGVAACGGGGGSDPDAHITTIDAREGCDPAVALPSQFRPIAEVSAGAVSVTTTAGVTRGTVDGTAGGISAAADNPYIYVNFAAGTKVDIDDIGAYADMTWDVAFKRASMRSNGGDSGPGGRSVAAIVATTIDDVTAAPGTGYLLDDFATEDCMYISIPGGEPMSAFGEWYDYDDQTHIVTPKMEVYVLSRPDGTHAAFEVEEYYGDPSMPTRGAFYRVAWKDL